MSRLTDAGWLERFLDLATVISSWSKDPSTKVGCVIVDRDRRIVSTGYNGLPRGVGDQPNRYETRDMKYPMIVHAEVNAVLHAGRRLEDCTLITMTFPCCRCAGVIIQSGLRRVACPDPKHDERMQREPWRTDGYLADLMLVEAGVDIEFIGGGQ